MAYHVLCYCNANPGDNPRAYSAKRSSPCDYGTDCAKGGTINVGDFISWTRHGLPPGARGPVAVESTASAPAAPSSVPAPSVADGLGAIIASAVLPHLEAAFESRGMGRDFDASDLADQVCASVMTEVDAKLASFKPAATRIEVSVSATGHTVDVGVQHRQFPLLLKAVSAGVPVWLAGPSGSGKTTAAQAVAKALDAKFYYTGAVGDAYALMGYRDVNGNYVRTAFRDAYENGGVFLWDEVDASDPNALLAFNAALANGHAAFPDGIIAKHPDCHMIAAANTWGAGATHEYVGRLRLDAAFLKRFAFISWDYDSDLETATAPNPDWTSRVQQVRRIVKELGLRVLVTPRESYLGAQLLAAGIERADVESMTIFSGMTAEQIRKVADHG